MTDESASASDALDPAQVLFVAHRRSSRSKKTSAPGGAQATVPVRGAAHRSGPHPDERDPQLLGTAVDNLLADRGWTTEAAVAGVTARWPELVGAEIAAHVRPDSFADETLHLTADSTAWAIQMRMLAPTVLTVLNRELGANTVRLIEVRGPSAPSWRKGPRSVKGRGPRDTYG